MLGKALSEAFLQVDARMRTVLDQKVNPNERSGCTAIAAVTTPTHIVTANAGDSRGVLSRGGRAVVSSSR